MTGSNRRPPACKAGALPAELIPRPKSAPCGRTLVGLVGLEPTTPALSRRCSNQLSYRPFTPGARRRSLMTKPVDAWAPTDAALSRLTLTCCVQLQPIRVGARLRVPYLARLVCRRRSCMQDRSPPCGFTVFQKGGDPAAPSDTATLLRLHPSHEPCRGNRPPCG